MANGRQSRIRRDQEAAERNRATLAQAPTSRKIQQRQKSLRSIQDFEARDADKLIARTSKESAFVGFSAARAAAARSGPLSPTENLKVFDSKLRANSPIRRRGRNFTSILGVRRLPAGKLNIERRTLLGGGGTLGA